MYVKYPTFHQMFSSKFRVELSINGDDSDDDVGFLHID